MSIQKNNYKVRLGLFILIGVTLFLSAIFIIGKQKNMFNPVFTLTSTFYNVSGLQVGNNIRFLCIKIYLNENKSQQKVFFMPMI